MMTHKKFFDEINKRLVYVGVSSNEKYWDEHWKNDEFGALIKIKKNHFISKYTKKYLPKGKRILEGGCGRGQNVYLLSALGYDSIGVDYAAKTVTKVNSLVPELNVDHGDVRSLDFEDNSFDGYWSLGVIEHFYDGYSEIIQEMARVLKHEGVLFITVPTMSVIRKMKSKLSLYPKWGSSFDDVERFYQFVLDPQKVINDLEQAGFKLLMKKPFDGVKGLKDEIELFRKPLQSIYNSDKLLLKIVKKIFDFPIRYFSSHMTFFVFSKK